MKIQNKSPLLTINSLENSHGFLTPRCFPLLAIPPLALPQFLRQPRRAAAQPRVLLRVAAVAHGPWPRRHCGGVSVGLGLLKGEKMGRKRGETGGFRWV